MMRATTKCPREALFDLASGQIDLAHAEVVQAHLRACGKCQAEFQTATAIMAELPTLRAPVTEAMEERVWAALAPIVNAEGQAARRRAAWRELLGKPLNHRFVPIFQKFQTFWQDRLRSSLRLGGALPLALLLAVPLLLAVATAMWTRGDQPSPQATVLTLTHGQNLLQNFNLQTPPTLEPPSPHEELAVRDALPPPRAVQATTASAQNPTEDQTLTQRSPTVAPRHVRGWHQVAQNPSEEGQVRETPGQALLACGAVVDLAAAQATLVRNLAMDAEIELEQGRVVLRVPKLPEGGRLAVRTVDAIIRVKGTAFAVDKRSRDLTIVEVFEGVVQVDVAGRNPDAGQGQARDPQFARETVFLQAGESRRFESLDAYLRRLIVEMDEQVAGGRLDPARETAQRYLAVAGPDGPDVDDVRLRLGGILSRTGHGAEAARVYRSVADGDGPQYARQNALAVLAVLHRDADQDDAERATWTEYVARFPDGLYAREAWVRLVELSCGRTDADADHARRTLAARFGQEPMAAGALERCRPH